MFIGYNPLRAAIKVTTLWWPFFIELWDSMICAIQLVALPSLMCSGTFGLRCTSAILGHTTGCNESHHSVLAFFYCTLRFYDLRNPVGCASLTNVLWHIWPPLLFGYTRSSYGLQLRSPLCGGLFLLHSGILRSAQSSWSRFPRQCALAH